MKKQIPEKMIDAFKVIEILDDEIVPKSCPFLLTSSSDSTIEKLDMDIIKNLPCECGFHHAKNFTQKECRESRIEALEIAKACLKTKKDAEKTMGKLREK